MQVINLAKNQINLMYDKLNNNNKIIKIEEG